MQLKNMSALEGRMAFVGSLLQKAEGLLCVSLYVQAHVSVHKLI